MTQTGDKDGPFARNPDWPEPGRGPVWSQKMDAVQAIKYAITNQRGHGTTDHEWCDAIVFGQDRIIIWINGTELHLNATRPTKQTPPPTTRQGD